MGYPMAMDLRSKMNESWKLLVCDISEDAITKFQSENKGKGPIEVVQNGFEAAKAAVGFAIEHHEMEILRPL